MVVESNQQQDWRESLIKQVDPTDALITSHVWHGRGVIFGLRPLITEYGNSILVTLQNRI